MKSLQIVAHTAGGEVRSAVEQATERDYELIKEGFKVGLNDREFVSFNTDEGWAIIPGSQVLYLEIKLY